MVPPSANRRAFWDLEAVQSVALSLSSGQEGKLEQLGALQSSFIFYVLSTSLCGLSGLVWALSLYGNWTAYMMAEYLLADRPFIIYL